VRTFLSINVLLVVILIVRLVFFSIRHASSAKQIGYLAVMLGLFLVSRRLGSRSDSGSGLRALPRVEAALFTLLADAFVLPVQVG